MCNCCPRQMNAKRHPEFNLDNYIVVNHYSQVNPKQVIDCAVENRAFKKEKYLILFGGTGAIPKLYNKEEIEKILNTNSE